MGGRKLAELIAIAMLMVGCGTGEVRSERASGSKETPTPSVSTGATPEAKMSRPPLPEPLRVSKLPAQGFVVGGRHKVSLVDLDGELLATLPGKTVAGHTRDRSGVWLREGAGFFRLEPGATRLKPVARAVWRRNTYAEVEPRDLPLPEGERKEKLSTGHWRYALRSPVSDVLLAQWSDECEVPSAHFVYPGADPINVMGPGKWWRHPSSLALGWTREGEALVYLPNGACGGGGDPPGIYAFPEPGVSELIFETKGYPTVTMWGDASRRR